MVPKTGMTRAAAMVLAAVLCAVTASAAALQFDGVNDVVSIPDSASVRITGNLTVEAWINRSVTGVQHSVVEKYGCLAGQGGYVLRVTAANNLLFGTRDDCNNGSSVTGASSIPANVWTHVAGSWDGVTLRVYVNGVLDGSLAATRNPKAGNTPLKIGERGNGGTTFFGMIDDVRVWNLARSLAQIQAAKGICLGGNETGLAGYWRLDEGDGLTAFDGTANHNNGTLINGPLSTSVGAPILCGAVPPPPPPPAPGPLPTVHIAATGAATAEFFPDGIHTLVPGVFTVWRSGPITTDLTVTLAIGGTASNGVDYDFIPSTVVIPAGSPSALIGVSPIDDALIEGAETVVVAVTTNAGYLVSVPSVDTVVIDDNDPTVSIVATDPLASEAGDIGTFTFSRTGPLGAPLPVFFRVQGSAQAGLDYVGLGSSAIIPAGASASTITVTVLDDLLVEGPENILVRLEDNPAYTIGLGQAEVTILDNDVPDAPSATQVVSAAGALGAMEFFPDGVHTNIPGAFTVFRSGPTAAALTVNYTMGGTALNGVDYETLPGSVIIPAGASSAQVLLHTIDDDLVEGMETATLTISPSPNYAVGLSPSGAIAILDNDPTVSVEAIDALASEAGDPGRFRFTRTGPVNSPLLVSFRAVGGATPGLDYIDPTSFIAIPAGASFVDLPVLPIQDTLNEGAETVEIRLAKLASYTVGNGIAVVTIDDDDVPPPPPVDLTITATDPAASETGPHPAVFTITRGGPTNLPLTISYGLSGTAVVGSDYLPILGAVPYMVDVPAGASSLAVMIMPIDDSFVEGTETVVMRINPSLDYTVIGTNAVFATIADNDAVAAPPPPPAAAGLRSLQFNGVNQSVQVPSGPGVDLTGPVTVEAWINRSVTGVQHSIVEKYGCNAGQGGYVLRVVANDKLLFGTRDDCNNGTSVVGATSLAANTWYHVAGTWDGTALRIYVNGVLDTTALPSTRNPKPGNTPLKIGERGNGGTPFNGLIDDVRVWNVARSAADLLANKNHCVPGNTPGLAGNWRFDEGAGAVAGDSSMSANAGALMNTPAWALSTGPTTCP